MSNDAHQIGIAIGKLTDQLTAKERELHLRETSQGTHHDVEKMNQLRRDIASLERRIAIAERLQDARTN
jgi:hypothetical protein